MFFLVKELHKATSGPEAENPTNPTSGPEFSAVNVPAVDGTGIDVIDLTLEHWNEVPVLMKANDTFPSFSLGLGLSSQSDEEPINCTPPGFFESAGEVCDLIQTFLHSDDIGPDIKPDITTDLCHQNVFDSVIKPDIKPDIKPFSGVIPIVICAQLPEATVVENTTIPLGSIAAAQSLGATVGIFAGSYISYVDYKNQHMFKVSSKGRALKGNKNYGSPYADPFLGGGDGGKRKRKIEANFWSNFDFSSQPKISATLRARMGSFIARLESQTGSRNLYMHDLLTIQSAEFHYFLKGGFVTSNVMSALLAIIHRELKGIEKWVAVYPTDMVAIASGLVTDIHKENSDLLDGNLDKARYLVVLSTNNEHWWMQIYDLKELVVEIYSPKPETSYFINQLHNEVSCIKTFLAWRFGELKFLDMPMKWMKNIPMQKKDDDSALLVLRCIISKIINKPLSCTQVDMDDDRLILAYHLLMDSSNGVKVNDLFK